MINFIKLKLFNHIEAGIICVLFIFNFISKRSLIFKNANNNDTCKIEKSEFFKKHIFLKNMSDTKLGLIIANYQEAEVQRLPLFL